MAPILYLILFITSFVLILLKSPICLTYATNGLNIWFYNMIPALFPFMVLSGILIRMELTDYLVNPLYPILKPLFRVSRSGCYVILIGFLCGFPMGAKCIADLYQTNKLTREESQYLLSFCNNIGPAYFIGFALPLIGISDVWTPIFVMYGLPFIYGIVLRFTLYRKMPITTDTPDVRRNRPMSFGQAFNRSIQTSTQNIIMLGGYMILFNLWFILPQIILPNICIYLYPLVEISGGLHYITNIHPIYSLLCLTFCGLSCLAQTAGCLAETDLSVQQYFQHKIILTLLSALFYGMHYAVFYVFCDFFH